MRSTEVSGAEAVIFGAGNVHAIRATLDAYVRERLGSGLAEVLFRAGRVDSVWAVRLEDQREVAVKAHRTPVDMSARRATDEAQQILSLAGFPCPTPIVTTSVFRGLILTSESLMTAGTSGDARDPAIRRSLAKGLADQIRILRGVPGLVAFAGPGPAWCRYQQGPWPVPHDSIFDFRWTPHEYR
ncbi:MAG: hypothetical protein JWP75_431 [Frondihabitans sp.]|nr:hypothetical protein [Frondihabitans sp.]